MNQLVQNILNKQIITIMTKPVNVKDKKMFMKYLIRNI